MGSIQPVKSGGQSVGLEHLVRDVNSMIAEAEALLPWSGKHPVGVVRWIHVDEIQANDYNPNAVAHHEMKLLHTSISEDGYTQPIVAIFDPQIEKYVIVDGFHRYTTMKRYPEVYETTQGYLPVVVLEKEIADRMASTVRHNRARGRHSVAGMGSMVLAMLAAGESDETIIQKLGLETEELARLKHVTGYSKLYANVPAYSKPVLTSDQVEAKAAYQKEHPDEVVPSDF